MGKQFSAVCPAVDSAEGEGSASVGCQEPSSLPSVRHTGQTNPPDEWVTRAATPVSQSDRAQGTASIPPPPIKMLISIVLIPTPNLREYGQSKAGPEPGQRLSLR